MGSVSEDGLGGYKKRNMTLCAEGKVVRHDRIRKSVSENSSTSEALSSARSLISAFKLASEQGTVPSRHRRSLHQDRTSWQQYLSTLASDIAP